MRQHRFAGHVEFLDSRAEDAVRLFGPGKVLSHVAIFPAPDLGDALRFLENVGETLDFRYVHATANDAHRIACDIALDQCPIQDGFVAAFGVADPIRRSPSPAVDERRAHGLFRGGKVAGMNPLQPGIRGGFQVFGNDPQHFLDAMGAVYDAFADVPLIDDAIDGIGSQAEYLLALREPRFRLFALGDVARIDDHAADQRVGECRDAARFQPAVRAVLVQSTKFARKALDLTGHQLPILGAQLLEIIRMGEVEHEVRFAFLGGVAERILHAGADVFHPAIGRGNRDDVLGMFRQGKQATFAVSLRAIVTPFRHFEAQDDEANDPRHTLERPHIDFEAARGPAWLLEREGFVMVGMAL